MTGERNPVWLVCHRCDHTWIAITTPVEVGIFVRALKRAMCPSCGEIKDIGIANQARGKLLPPENAA